MKEGVDIHDELKIQIFDTDLIKECEVLCVKNHFVTDSSTESMFEEGSYKRRNFEALLRWRDEPLFPSYGLVDESWYKRNTGLLTSRCSLHYPDDQYKAIPIERVPYFSKHVRRYLWNRVKHSDLCCCVSRFFCSSSENLHKCKNGCCEKCLEDQDENENYSEEDNSVEDSPSSDNQSSCGGSSDDDSMDK